MMRLEFFSENSNSEEWTTFKYLNDLKGNESFNITTPMLEFYYPDSEKINIDMLIQISSICTDNQNLTHLIIKFNNVKSMEIEGLVILFAALSSLKGLKSLDIDFS